MNINVTVPEELYQKALDIAHKQGVSVDDVLGSALAEKLTAWERLQQHPARGQRQKFLGVLDRAPRVELDERDKL